MKRYRLSFLTAAVVGLVVYLLYIVGICSKHQFQFLMLVSAFLVCWNIVAAFLLTRKQLQPGKSIGAILTASFGSWALLVGFILFYKKYVEFTITNTMVLLLFLVYVLFKMALLIPVLKEQ